MTQCVMDYEHPRFGGETFDVEKDGRRLTRQLDMVRAFMLGGDWWTLQEIAFELGFPEASVSARLRQLRALGETVERRRMRDGGGTWEYRVVES